MELAANVLERCYLDLHFHVILFVLLYLFADSQKEIEEATQFLHRHSVGRSVNWPQVINAWKKLAPSRLRSLYTSSAVPVKKKKRQTSEEDQEQPDVVLVHAYFKEWPVLRHGSGFELVRDFFLISASRCFHVIHRSDLNVILVILNYSLPVSP